MNKKALAIMIKRTIKELKKQPKVDIYRLERFRKMLKDINKKPHDKIQIFTKLNEWENS